MKKTLLGLYAHSNIHAGSGDEVSGVIDLPIQREGHTGWPVIFGSALKGAMRGHAFNLHFDKELTSIIFGDESTDGSEHAGAMSVSDAKLLLLPVRSLNRHFYWVTSPALLERYASDLLWSEIGNIDKKLANLKIDDIDDNTAITHGNPDQNNEKARIFLEEFSFREKKKNLSDMVDLIAIVMDSVFGEEDIKKNLKNQILIVSNNIFSHLAQFSTVVIPHTSIDQKTKTVKKGALWYEESLPSQTVLYASVLMHPSRKKTKNENDDIKPDVLINHLKNDFIGKDNYLQVGGNETKGMGICRMKLI